MYPKFKPRPKGLQGYRYRQKGYSWKKIALLLNYKSPQAISTCTSHYAHYHNLPYPPEIKRRTKNLKEHEVAIMVNELTEVAKKYGHAQSCRQAIRVVVIKHLEFLPSPKRNLP